MSNELFIEISGSGDKAVSALDKVIAKLSEFQNKLISVIPKLGRFNNLLKNIPAINSLNSLNSSLDSTYRKLGSISNSRAIQKIAEDAAWAEEAQKSLANAMGVHQTFEKQDDGSFIYYAHDKPTLSESQIVWRQTRDAFAVSFDGGATWHGMTAGGNIVAQILTAIGINADWITTGTLRVGGNFNQSGTIELFDISNTLICLIDKDGITVKCKDGRTIKLNAEAGLAGFDTDNTKIYWADRDEFHTKKSVVENEITIAQRLRFIPITTAENTGVGVVAML